MNKFPNGGGKNRKRVQEKTMNPIESKKKEKEKKETKKAALIEKSQKVTKIQVITIKRSRTNISVN